MAEQKVVILGGRGMLGTDLALACRNYKIDTTILDLPEFDITNEEHLRSAVENAATVINCAAYTNVEKAQSQSESAHKVNAEAVGKLGTIAKKAGVWVLHISTDFVFDGTCERPYIETDEPNPINEYGKSKLAGEQLLVESGCNHSIIRLEWTYGQAGNNFIIKLISLAKQGTDLKVVDDQIGSPTATSRAAEVICDFIHKKVEGLFHFASSGYVSRFEMAKFVFDKLNINVNLSRCKTSDYACAAVRPLNSCFDCSKIEALLCKPIENWKIELERFLEKL